MIERLEGDKDYEEKKIWEGKKGLPGGWRGAILKVLVRNASLSRN